MKQYWLAQSTQVSSQVIEQQFGSIAHTVLQQSASEQFGFSWGARQLPVAGSPHLSVTSIARLTQSVSHALLQHSGSIAHTASHTGPVLHDGVGCGSKQLSGTLPQSEQNLVASWTHTSSHATSQHDGSIEQTSAQHDGLLQPGARRLVVKQSLVAFTQPCADAFRVKPVRVARKTSAVATTRPGVARPRVARVDRRDRSMRMGAGIV